MPVAAAAAADRELSPTRAGAGWLTGSGARSHAPCPC